MTMWHHILIVGVSLGAIALWIYWGRLTGYGGYAALPVIVFIARSLFYLLLLAANGRAPDPWDSISSFIDLYSSMIWAAGAYIMIRRRRHGQ